MLRGGRGSLQMTANPKSGSSTPDQEIKVPRWRREANDTSSSCIHKLVACLSCSLDLQGILGSSESNFQCSKPTQNNFYLFHHSYIPSHTPTPTQGPEKVGSCHRCMECFILVAMTPWNNGLPASLPWNPPSWSLLDLVNSPVDTH